MTLEDEIYELKNMIQRLCPHNEVKEVTLFDDDERLVECIICKKDGWIKRGQKKWFKKIIKG